MVGRGSHRFFGQSIASRVDGEFQLELSQATVPAAVMKDHYHHGAHIVLALDSGYRSAARPSHHSARAGEAIYNPPGTVHRDHFDDVGSRYLSVAFPRELAPDGDRPIVIEDEEAYRLMLRAVGQCLSRVVPDAIEQEGLLLELVSLLPGDRPDEARQGWLCAARDAIDEASAEQGATITIIAMAIGIHPVHLARAYRAAFGHGPGEAMRRHRVQRAIGLLRGPEPLAAIAAASGYADQSHMTREFIARAGVSPGRMRRRLSA